MPRSMFDRKGDVKVSFCARVICTALAVLLLAVALPAAAAPTRANTGTVTSLIGSGAENPGDPISISSQVRADSRVTNSNLYYEVYAPGGALVDTHQTNPPSFQAGDTFFDSWSTSNTPASGTYTVTLCWSTGNAKNCDITSATTSFYSVPTLGTALTGLGGLLLAGFLWRNRRLFEQGAR